MARKEKKMKIALFGTSKFSELVAEGLKNSNHEIVAVVTQPDKVNGRNNKVSFNELKLFAIKNNIPCYQFEKLNRDGEQILKDLKADCFVTASYGQIIRQNILDICPIYNVHASLLPRYRGSAPIQWCLINGEKKTGITIMKTELGIDSGEMYLKKELAIEPDDTSDSLFEKLGVLGASAIVEFLDNIEHYKQIAMPQDENQMSYFPMLKKEMAQLNFDNESEKLVNLIRGLSTCMTAYFLHNNLRYKVIFASVVSKEKLQDVNTNFIQVKPGTVIASSGKKGLIIKTKDGAIEIVKIQPEGKNVMNAKEFCNGGKIKVGDLL